MSEKRQVIELQRTANAPVTEGVHVFTIANGEEAEGPKGPYWKLVFSCETPEEKGKSVFFNLSLSPQSRWRLEIFLDAVGAPSKGTAPLEQFIGRKLRAQVLHEVYEGRPQARIGEMWAMSAGPKKATAPAVVTEISSKKTASLPDDAVEDDIPEEFR